MKKLHRSKKSEPRAKRALRKQPSKPSSPRRQPAALGPKPGELAAALAEDSRNLYTTAHIVHHTADELHHAIDDLHHSIETPELVIDEKNGGEARPFPIVGIGASACGYEAFSELLAALPKGIGMAFVLVQHLDPHHRSKLAELLGATTKIPLTEATDGLEVEPNHIYVIPENTSMTIQRGCLRLSARRTQEVPPMPIDHFFRSLAAHQEERAIGVVLSGTGSDGSLGIEVVKGEGGITFAQDERTAKFFGMPSSAIASGSVDFTLSPAEIAKELDRIAQHPYVGRPARAQAHAPGGPLEVEKLLRESPEELRTVFNLLRARTAVDFALYKQTTLRRRIIRRMVLHKLDSLRSYVQLLECNSAEVDALFNDLLINVTNFFRDPDTFEVLKRKLFPRILKARSEDGPLRCWVCGCATGEEAYSLAMALTEFSEENPSRPSAVQIFATDISDASIEKARCGIYPENIQQDVSTERLRRFFNKVNGSFQVHKSIRDMCVFARQNVGVDPPFSNLDLITCRNVLIYFGSALQRRLIPLFHYALRPTGFLLLGKSESIGASSEQFSLHDKKHKIYARKTSYVRPGFDLMHRPHESQARRTGSGEPAPSRETKPPDLQQQVDRILLKDFSPGAVLTNADFEVVMFRGQTGDYLEHAPGQASLNLLKMVRESLVIGLRAALNRALKTGEPVKQTGLELRLHRQVRELILEVVPFRLGFAQERFFLVIFREVPGVPAAEPALSAKTGPRARVAQTPRELNRLRQELSATKESIQTIIEEQEATNEELKSANEEIHSSNEELQSTNEELETAKEELQSTNEELTTLNEELQNRNLELSQVNNDLINLLASVHVPILMLGNDLTIRRFTPMAERLFNLIPADVGRRLSDLTRSIFVLDLDAAVREVIDNLTPIEREAKDREGHWYMLRIRPYRTRENKIEGAVIVLVDIDDLRRAIDIVLGTVRESMLVLDADLTLRKANKAFCDAFKLLPAEIEGKGLFEIGDGQWNTPLLRSALEDVLPKKKELIDFEFEAPFNGIGQRRIRINARRFFARGSGADLILLAVEELTGKKLI